MRSLVLVDAGPLVAILCREDAYHEQAVAALKKIDDDLVTCWPVVTEVVHLLGGRVDRVRQLLAMITSGAVPCLELPSNAAQWLDVFYVRFADQMPDLADAAIMCLADANHIGKVFTLDQRDFTIYRTTDNRNLQLITIG